MRDRMDAVVLALLAAALLALYHLTRRMTVTPIQHRDPGDEAPTCPVCGSNDVVLRVGRGDLFCRAEYQIRHPWAHKTPVIPSDLERAA